MSPPRKAAVGSTRPTLVFLDCLSPATRSLGLKAISYRRSAQKIWRAKVEIKSCLSSKNMQPALSPRLVSSLAHCIRGVRMGWQKEDARWGSPKLLSPRDVRRDFQNRKGIDSASTMGLPMLYNDPCSNSCLSVQKFQCGRNECSIAPVSLKNVFWIKTQEAKN
jgi:hypothetical protein